MIANGSGFGAAADVVGLQTALTKAGYPVGASGTVGTDTVVAVADFLLAVAKAPPQMLPQKVKDFMGVLKTADSWLRDNTKILDGVPGIGSFGLSGALRNASKIPAVIAAYNAARDVSLSTNYIPDLPPLPDVVKNLASRVNAYAQTIANFVANNASAITTAIGLFAPVDGAPVPAGGVPSIVTVAPGIALFKGKYRAGSVARFNKSRSVWSIYSPRADGVSGFGASFWQQIAVTPDPPAGYEKVGEEPQRPQETPDAGTERDKHWYTNPWIMVPLGLGVAGAAVGTVVVLRRRRRKAA